MKLQFATALLLALAAPAYAGQAVTLYSNPTCDCCKTYADYLTSKGFDVTMVPDPNYDTVATKAGMPQDGIGCHVAVVDGYTLSGFIPAKFIEKLIADKPDVAGLTLPGMRMDAPDMADDALTTLQVYAYAPTGVTLYPVE